MQDASVGIGIVGAGFGAAVQLPAFLRLQNAHVVGIVSTHQESSKELARLHGLPHSFDSWEELIASPEVQLVSVASPQFTHAEIVSAAIAAGKHVLCEKPFGISLAQARSLLSQAQEAGIVHAIDFEFRHLPAWQMLHTIIKGGSMGRVLNAELQWIVGTWADPLRPWRWQCDKALGGGVTSALGVHLLDAAEWMFGPARRVRGMFGTTIAERPDPIGGGKKSVTSDDHAHIELQGENGVPLHIRVSNIEPAGAGLSITIQCEHGVLRQEAATADYGAGLRVVQQRTGEASQILWEDPSPPPGDARIPAFQTMASLVVNAVQHSDFSFRPSFIEGVRTQQLCYAAQRSQEAGTWVDIAESAL